jgi:hypothetical protein
MYYINKHFPIFPKWHKWDDKNNIDGTERLGAYVLGVWNNSLCPKSNVLSEEVVYIGEVHGNSRDLMARWKEFEKVALGKAENHSGAKTFRQKGFLVEDLWLVAFPVPKHFNILGDGILAQLLERELIWTYYTEYKKLPICNKK